MTAETRGVDLSGTAFSAGVDSVDQADEVGPVARRWARDSRLWLVALLAVALGVVGVLQQAGRQSLEHDFLLRSSSIITVGAGATPAGERHFFHVVTPRPLGTRPIHLLRAEILGVPEGLVIDGVWAIRFSETKPSFVGHTSGEEAAAQLRPKFHKVSEVVLDPSCPPSARCEERLRPGPEGTPVQDWYLLVEMHSTRAGRFETEGFRVFAEVDGRELRQSDLKMKFVVESTEKGEGS